MEALNLLFESPVKVRIMKLFVHNSDIHVTTKEVAARVKTTTPSAKAELARLQRAGLIKQKAITGKKREKGWILNKDFTYLNGLKNLLTSDKQFTKQGLARRFKDAGRVKFIVASGVFIQDDASRVDLFVVGDYIKPGKVDAIVKKIEAELGKELEYAVCETNDFVYRLNAYDKFVRDVLDYPHEVVLDKLGVETL